MTSCYNINKPKPTNYEEIKKSYKEHLSLYEKNLTSHFPDIDSGECNQFSVNNADTKASNFINLVMSFSDKKIKDIETYANKYAIKKYHFTDNCLMLLNYSPEIYENNSIFKLNMCQKLSPDMLPVSNFVFCEDVSIISKKYIKRATIYVLGAEKGKFLSDDTLSTNGVGLPEGWEHGYTRGMAIYSNTVVYWLELW